MIAVIFEVWLAADAKSEYLDHAARLRAELDHIDGFISVERFQSIADPGKLLSLSFWRDEEAVATWRNHELHRQTQAIGRARVFPDYRIRVAIVGRDYDKSEHRDEAPEDSRQAHAGTGA